MTLFRYLKYDISSTINRTVDGMIQQNGGDYQAYISKRLSLTPEVQPSITNLP